MCLSTPKARKLSQGTGKYLELEKKILAPVYKKKYEIKIIRSKMVRTALKGSIRSTCFPSGSPDEGSGLLAGS